MEKWPLIPKWCALLGRRSTGVERPNDGLAEPEVDLEIFDDVSFVKDGAKVYGTVTEIRDAMAKVNPFDDSEPIWVDWRKLDIL